MRGYSDERIGELLTELEALGLVKSVASSAEHDLDFTGSLSLAALRAAIQETKRPA
jgi:Cdc6-like AAA superfamily ATPase